MNYLPIKNLERLQRFSISEFLHIIKNTPPDKRGIFPFNTILSDGRHVYGKAHIRVHRQRMKLFLRSLKCACCGCEAKYVWLELDHNNGFALMPYAPKNGGEIRITVDHINPKSLGGKLTNNNMQTLCQPCNRRKGNQPITLHELQKITHI